jgi:hypothetical protein
MGTPDCHVSNSGMNICSEIETFAPDGEKDLNHDNLAKKKKQAKIR